jgi:uncharacterized caspase-like protein
MVSKAETSGRTFALVIGISKYPHLPQLDTAESDAQHIAMALLDKRGCRLPRCQVRDLTEARATSWAILDAISAVAEEASASDMIFIYFAGHGEPLEGDFALCAWNTTLDALNATAVRGSEVGDRLAKTRARGVLLVIDCCYGANFAENAPAFFRIPGTAEFRILISSTRATQRSWEHADGNSTLFSRYFRAVLDGSVPVGAIPGAIFFSDLSRYVARKITEDLSGRDPSLAQEPVTISLYNHDPLLFVQARLTGRRVLLFLARYSVHDVIRFGIRGTATSTAALLLLSMAHYSLLERSEYAQSNGNRIDIEQGWPGLNWYGFPRPLGKRIL